MQVKEKNRDVIDIYRHRKTVDVTYYIAIAI